MGGDNEFRLGAIERADSSTVEAGLEMIALILALQVCLHRPLEGLAAVRRESMLSSCGKWVRVAGASCGFSVAFAKVLVLAKSQPFHGFTSTPPHSSVR
jgi:hypothetical protein